MILALATVAAAADGCVCAQPSRTVLSPADFGDGQPTNFEIHLLSFGLGPPELTVVADGRYAWDVEVTHEERPDVVYTSVVPLEEYPAGVGILLRDAFGSRLGSWSTGDGPDSEPPVWSGDLRHIAGRGKENGCGGPAYAEDLFDLEGVDDDETNEGSFFVEFRPRDEGEAFFGNDEAAWIRQDGVCLSMDPTLPGTSRAYDVVVRDSAGNAAESMVVHTCGCATIVGAREAAWPLTVLLLSAASRARRGGKEA